MTAHSIYTTLLSTSAISPSTADLFKPVSSSTASSNSNNNNNNSNNNASSPSADNTNLLSTPLPTLTDPQLRQLDAGHALLVLTQNNRPIVCLPDRRPLLGLSHQQATRFVELFDTLGGVVPPFASSHDNSPSDMEKLLPGYRERLVPATTAAAAAAAADNDAEDFEDDDEDDEEGEGVDTGGEEDGGEMVNTFAISEAAAAAAAAAAVNASTALPGPISSSTQDPSTPAPARTGPRIVSFGDPNNLKQSGWGKEARLKVEEMEGKWAGRKRECEAVEKRLNALIKKNRRLVLGGGAAGGS